MTRITTSPRPRHAARLVASLLALSLVAGACGSDDEPAAQSSSSSSSSTPASTDAPTTEPPTSEAPTSDAPTTDAPTTDAPASSAPVAAAPTAEDIAQLIADQQAVPEVHALLPRAIRDAGRLDVGAAAAIPPLDFFLEGTTTLVGSDVDLGDAIGKVLGVEWEREVVPFAQQVVGVESGQFDIAMGDVGDIATRRPQVDFVDYMKLNFSVLFPNDNPADVHELLDMCGNRYGTVSGQAGVGLLRVEEACEKADLPAPEVIVYNDLASNLVALQAGRVDAQINLTPLAAYYKDQGALDYFEVPEVGDMLIGILTPVGSTELQSALVAALEVLVENGTYQAILDRWNIGSLAHNTPGVNQGETKALFE